MAGSTLTTRLPEWLEAEVREEFAGRGEGPSEGLRRLVEEWWVLTHLPLIEYREGAGVKRPALRGGPKVWAVIWIGRSYGEDIEGLKEHFGGLTDEQIHQARAYYSLFPEPIDSHIRENERLERLHEEGLL